MKQKNQNLCNKSQLARMFGVSRQKIDNLNKLGLIVWERGWINISATKSIVKPADLKPQPRGRKPKHYLERKHVYRVRATPQDMVKIKRIITKSI